MMSGSFSIPPGHHGHDTRPWSLIHIIQPLTSLLFQRNGASATSGTARLITSPNLRTKQNAIPPAARRRRRALPSPRPVRTSSRADVDVGRSCRPQVEGRPRRRCPSIIWTRRNTGGGVDVLFEEVIRRARTSR